MDGFNADAQTAAGDIGDVINSAGLRVIISSRNNEHCEHWVRLKNTQKKKRKICLIKLPHWCLIKTDSDWGCFQISTTKVCTAVRTTEVHMKKQLLWFCTVFTLKNHPWFTALYSFSNACIRWIYGVDHLDIAWYFLNIYHWTILVIWPTVFAYSVERQYAYLDTQGVLISGTCIPMDQKLWVYGRQLSDFRPDTRAAIHGLWESSGCAAAGRSHNKIWD